MFLFIQTKQFNSEDQCMKHAMGCIKKMLRCSIAHHLPFVLLLSLSASNLWAVNIYTKKGPAMVFTSSDVLHLFFTGHNNDYIWEASYNFTDGLWTGHDRILNEHGECARTTERPAPLTVNKMFFHGNIANDYIWYVYRGSSSSEWKRPDALEYHPTADPVSRENFLMKSSPAVEFISWNETPLSTPTIFYTDLLTGRMSFSVETDAVINWWAKPRLLPAECVSNVGPAVAFQSGRPVVFYAKKTTDEIFAAMKGTSSINRDDWSIVGIPRAFTRVEPSAINVNDGGILLAYKGHNNNKIWLNLYRPGFGDILESSNWKRLGYVAGIETDQAPALLNHDGRIYLAFKEPDIDAWHPRFDVDIGYLTIDEDNAVDTPGHTFSSFR
jgi:hypothetical protein